MVEAVAAARALPDPARLARLVAVELSEGVAESVRLETLDQRKLSLVPAFSPLRPELAVTRTGEGPHPSIRVLAPGRVEVAADDARARAARQPPVEQLTREDLRPA